MKSVDIVVARCQEDITWLNTLVGSFQAEYNEINLQVIVYNKGEQNLKLHQSIIIKTLSPWGNDCHSYLTYLVEEFQCKHKDLDSHMVIFLTDKLLQHLQMWCRGYTTPMAYITDIVKDVKAHGASIKWVSKHEQVGLNSAHYNFRIKHHNNEELNPLMTVPFGEWFNKNNNDIQMAETTLLHWWIGNVFSVHSTVLAKKDINFYQNILKQIHGPRPEIEHYIERSWLYITGAYQSYVDAQAQLQKTVYQKHKHLL